MAEEVWEAVLPYIRGRPKDSRLSFAGHSLGGSLALLLTVFTRQRLGIAPAGLLPTHLFGSPPVITLMAAEAAAGAEAGTAEVVHDGRAILQVQHRAPLTHAQPALGQPAPRLPLLTRAIAHRASLPLPSHPTNPSLAIPCMHKHTISLSLSFAVFRRPKELGLPEESVRWFVADHDLVPRLWNAADPMYAYARRSSALVRVLQWREQVFGGPMLTEQKFLYDMGAQGAARPRALPHAYAREPTRSHAVFLRVPP